MSDALQQILSNIKNWAANAQSQGWLRENAVQALDATNVATPGELFDKPNRPLVVGFFGGTGVGKSTLLNRFAGEEVARTSVERPTSREITLYVHESVAVANLPKEFPMTRMRTQSHHNTQYRSVMWIDMPDFDSVEQSNRELVEHWLPHIDVVIYVVSPERYRDDQGWRLLLQHGQQHAWLFAINHWDKGDQRQKDDFTNMLREAGLKDPLIFCTDSSQNGGSDDFESFSETISTLADQQLIAQLESRGVVQRLKQIRVVTDSLRSQMGTAESIQRLPTQWSQQWQTDGQALADSVDWKIPPLATHYADQERGLISALIARISNKNNDTDQQTAGKASNQHSATLVDEAFIGRISESIDEFTQQRAIEGIPLLALQQKISPLQESWLNRTPDIMEAAVQQSLAAPGSSAHRLLHKLLGWLCWLLPLAAMGWVGYRVVNGFRLGADDPTVYLSSNFAVHSLLLLGLAWLVPTFLTIKLKPSREQAAARGLRQGVENVTHFIDEQVTSALSQLSKEHDQQQIDLNGILSAETNFNDSSLPAALQRMLISPKAN
jgi:GTP-binding protein EngB required for normal cell division